MNVDSEELRGSLRTFLLKFRLYYYSIELFSALLFPLATAVVVLNVLALFSIPPFIYQAGLAFFLTWVFVQLYRTIRKLPLSDRGCALVLEQLDPAWEVLRAYLFQRENTYLHSYFSRRLTEELQGLLNKQSVDSLFSQKKYSQLFCGLLLVAVLPVVVPPGPALELGPEQGRRSLALQVSRPVVLRGDTVTVSASGNHLDGSPVLQVRHREKNIKRVEWIRQKPRFSWSSFPLRRSISFRAISPNKVTDWKQVEVVEKPQFTGRKITISPPEYTDGKKQVYQERQVSFYPGSQLELALKTNRVFEFIKIENASGKLLKKVHNQKRCNYFAPLQDDGEFVVSGADSYGFQVDTFSLVLNSKTDAPPSLQLLEPDPDKKVEGAGLLPLRVRFNDDFGLSRARVSYWRQGRSQKYSAKIPVPEEQAEGELYGQIDRSALDLLPGESFKFTVSAWDNDTVRGPKKTTSGPFRIVVFSWAEMMARENRLRARGTSLLKKMSGAVDKLEKELGNMMRRKKSRDWEKARRMQKIQKQLQRQQKKLRQARQKINQYRKNSAGLSSNHLRKLKEIRKMVNKFGLKSLEESREALNKALKKQLKEGKLDKKQLRYSRKSLKKFQQDIERMHSYLKKLGPALKMDKMGHTLDKMSEQQKKLAGQKKWNDADRRQLKQQAKKWEWMKKQLEQIEKKVQGKAKRKVRKMLKKIRAGTPADRARKLAGKAKKSARDFEEYQQFTKNMRRDFKQLLSARNKQLSQEKQSLKSMLVNYWTAWFAQLQAWSKEVGRLRLPPRFRAQFNSQMVELNQALQGGVELQSGWTYLVQLTERIGKMDLNFPREILQKLEPQAERLQQVTERLKERRTRGLNKKLKKLQKKQARLIAAFLNWKSRQRTKGGKGGATPSLSQLLKQQRQLMKNMTPLFKSPSVSPQLARKFARQQMMIQQGMQNIMSQRKQQKEVLGDLKRLAGQMKKASKRMKKKKFDKKLKSQQKTILQRLEQATKSLTGKSEQQIKKEKKRSATAATGTDTRSFAPSDYQQIMKKLQPEISDLSPEEREAVLRFYRYWFRQQGREEPVQ